MNMSRALFLLVGALAAASAADVVTVTPAGVMTIAGIAPATPAASAVNVGGGTVNAGTSVIAPAVQATSVTASGSLSAGNVTISRTTQAAATEAVRGDDPRLVPQQLTGSVTMYAGTGLPTGWLRCDGTAVSRTTYAALFAAIGTTYGAGDGSTTFNLPDLNGRAPFGAGAGTGLTARTLGATGGEEVHLLTPLEMPKHSHGLGSGVSGIDNIATWNSAGGDGNSRITTATDIAGGDQPHPIMPPFLIINFLIKI